MPTESQQEYREHVDEWLASLSPSSLAENQLVMLLADQAWRLRRIERIEQRRALEVLQDLVEESAEFKAQEKLDHLLAALTHVDSIVRSIPLPVPSAVLNGFIKGLASLEQLFDDLRDALQPELWPDAEIVHYQSARKILSGASDENEFITEPFIDLGRAVAGLVDALHGLQPHLQAEIERARLHLATTNLLTDKQDAQLQRHRRLLESSMSRELDLLAKLRSVAQGVSSVGSFEPHLPALRVIDG